MTRKFAGDPPPRGVLRQPWSFEIPWRGIPKPRPQVTENGVYNPAHYTEWKDNIKELLSHHRVAFEGPVSLDLLFTEKSVHVRVIPVVENFQRDKWVKGDLDNLAGGVMDALQDAGLIDNDRDVVQLHAGIKNRVEP